MHDPINMKCPESANAQPGNGRRHSGVTADGSEVFSGDDDETVLT